METCNSKLLFNLVDVFEATDFERKAKYQKYDEAGYLGFANKFFFLNSLEENLGETYISIV